VVVAKPGNRLLRLVPSRIRVLSQSPTDPLVLKANVCPAGNRDAELRHFYRNRVSAPHR